MASEKTEVREISRRRVSDDERELVQRVAKPDLTGHDEKALLEKVRRVQQMNGGGDPGAKTREGLRCRFPGGIATKLRQEKELRDGVEWLVDKEYRVMERPCDSLIVVAADATEPDVLMAIKQRRDHEQGVHGYVHVDQR